MIAILMSAVVLSCNVYSVHDGDTVSVDCAGNRKKVRLAGIDAPELKQQYGRESRQALANLVFRKTVTVRRKTSDKYGRDVAEIGIQGHDVSSLMVRDGYAWVYERYPIRSLYPLQQEARRDRRGLWANAYPVAPWEWRHSH